MSIAACAEMVRRGDADRFLAAMAAPPASRELLWPLYAFNLEVARAPWLTQEPIIAEMRLQFWRDTLDEIAAGHPPRAHEVAAPLHALHDEVGLPVPALHRMIDARRADISRAPFASAQALWTYLEDSAGALMWASVAVLGGGDEAASMSLGRVSGLAAWLDAQPAVIAQGWQAMDSAHYPDMIDRGLADLATLKRHDFRQGTPAARAAWQARNILTRAKSDPGAIAAGRLGGSEFFRRGSLLVRTLRGRW